MQANERVVVIKGDASKWYSQVVFIMNPNTPASKIPVDFVAEAEKIIYKHMVKKNKLAGDSIHAYLPDYYTPPAIITAPAKRSVTKDKKHVRFDLLLYVLMIAACIAMAVVFAVGIN